MGELQARITAAGLPFKRDETIARHFKAMVRFVGGLDHLHFLCDDYWLRVLFNAQVRKGKAYNYKQLDQMARPVDASERFTLQFEELVERYILYRGYSMVCDACAVETFYLLERITDSMMCPGCRLPIKLPLELEFAFALNPLFLAGINQGAVTVLLTALYLSQQCRSFEWDTMLQVGATDIDLLALCDDELIVAECKDTIRPGLAEQIERVKSVAEQISADRLMLASVDEQTTELDLPGVRVVTREMLLNTQP